MFKVEEDDWTLDLREGKGSVAKGVPSDKPDLTLTVSDENFAKMVMGKLNPQQVGFVVSFCDGRGARARVGKSGGGGGEGGGDRHPPTQHTHANKQYTNKAFLLRKLKISGSMGMALKLQPILDAAAPKAKL